jgi:hypothetical protein
LLWAPPDHNRLFGKPDNLETRRAADEIHRPYSKNRF